MAMMIKVIVWVNADLCIVTSHPAAYSAVPWYCCGKQTLVDATTMTDGDLFR